MTTTIHMPDGMTLEDYINKRKIEQLMCKKCHSIPCLCTTAPD